MQVDSQEYRDNVAAVDKPKIVKRQITAHVPAEIVAHAKADYADTGLHKGNRVLAGLCMFECCTPSLRVTMIRWSVALMEGQATWEDLLQHVKKAKAAALDEKALRRLIDRKMQEAQAVQELRPAS